MAVINNLLTCPNWSCATEQEVLLTIAPIFCRGVYSCSLTGLFDKNNRDCFHATEIKDHRHTKDILKAASGAIREQSGKIFISNGATEKDIMAMEEAFSSTCSKVFDVDGASDFSIDDDFMRQRTKRLSRETSLNQENIPKMLIGANNTMLADSFTDLTLAMRYVVTWSRS